jgi:four helix bundle protein
MRKIDNYENNILSRTRKFAVDVIKFSSKFPRNASGFVIADQLIRAVTSIGANLIEAQEAFSSKDFFYKISISLKEAKETKYWLELTKESLFLDDKVIVKLLQESEEIVKILVTTLNKLKSK